MAIRCSTIAQLPIRKDNQPVCENLALRPPVRFENLSIRPVHPLSNPLNQTHQSFTSKGEKPHGVFLGPLVRVGVRVAVAAQAVFRGVEVRVKAGVMVAVRGATAVRVGVRVAVTVMTGG